jgi:hypothetical protein
VFYSREGRNPLRCDNAMQPKKEWSSIMRCERPAALLLHSVASTLSVFVSALFSCVRYQLSCIYADALMDRLGLKHPESDDEEKEGDHLSRRKPFFGGILELPRCWHKLVKDEIH